MPCLIRSVKCFCSARKPRATHVAPAARANEIGFTGASMLPKGILLVFIPRYKFFTAHSGFVDQHYKAGNNDTGPLFSLHSGEKVTDVLFRLIAAAVITGRITNEDGDGMERVQVVALRRPTQEETEEEDELPRRHKTQMQPVASAESDDRGQYRIFDLKPGEYYLRAGDSAH